MNRRVIRFAIVVAVVFEIIWSLEPRNMSWPRSSETAQAIHVWQASPSDSTKAAMLEQTDLDVARNTRHGQILLGLMLVADIVAIYFLWNYGVTKPAASSNLAPETGDKPDNLSILPSRNKVENG
jgi:hypothetical protein